MRRTGIPATSAAIIVGVFLVCGPREARGQAPAGVGVADTVTATSGDTAAIMAIRSLQREIDRELPRMRTVQRDLEGWSLEGGYVVGAFRGDELRKVHAHHYGESFRSSEELYYRNGALAFAYIVQELYVGEHYLESSGGKIALRIVHRLYFDRGRLIRRVRTQTPAVHEWDVSYRDPQVGLVLENAKELVACVRGKGEKPAECARPDPEG